MAPCTNDLSLPPSKWRKPAFLKLCVSRTWHIGWLMKWLPMKWTVMPRPSKLESNLTAITLLQKRRKAEFLVKIDIWCVVWKKVVLYLIGKHELYDRWIAHKESIILPSYGGGALDQKKTRLWSKPEGPSTALIIPFCLLGVCWWFLAIKIFSKRFGIDFICIAT